MCYSCQSPQTFSSSNLAFLTHGGSFTSTWISNHQQIRGFGCFYFFIWLIGFLIIVWLTSALAEWPRPPCLMISLIIVIIRLITGIPWRQLSRNPAGNPRELFLGNPRERKKRSPVNITTLLSTQRRPCDAVPTTVLQCTVHRSTVHCSAVHCSRPVHCAVQHSAPGYCTATN